VKKQRFKLQDEYFRLIKNGDKHGIDNILIRNNQIIKATDDVTMIHHLDESFYLDFTNNFIRWD